jgi:hypothetical protein
MFLTHIFNIDFLNSVMNLRAFLGDDTDDENDR